MNWKDYKVEPEEGMFEKIQHRLRVRRAWRMVGIAAGVVVAAFVVVAILLPKSSDDNMMAVNQTVVADEPTTVQQMPAIEETSQSIVDNRQQTTVNMQPATQESDVDLASLLPQTPSSPATQPLSHTATQSPDLPMDQQLYGAVNPLPNIVCRAPQAQTPEQEQTSSPTTATKSGEPQPEPYHEDNLLWVPNIIVPGGDRDENRYFRIITSSPISEFNIHIYNRGGRLLYSSNDPAFVWDATHNGTHVPQGAYVYVATFRDTDGNPRQQTGTVTVIR